MRIDIPAIEAVIQTEVERKIAPLARAAAGGLSEAASAVAFNPSPRVVVVSGAYVPWASHPSAETDGPPGSALLAAGLSRLRIPARLLTDPLCAPVVNAAAAQMDPQIPLDVCDDDPNALAALVARYERTGVTHIVAVERIGPAADGVARNFRGEDITQYTAVLAPLWRSSRPWETIGVGDGGNEIGMGNIAGPIVAAAVDGGEGLHCVVRCDHLVVAGVSNWGALALLLAIAGLRGERDGPAFAYLEPRYYRAAVAACVHAGAVDGTRGISQETVDGVDMATHDQLLREMLATVKGDLRL